MTLPSNPDKLMALGMIIGAACVGIGFLIARIA